MPCTVRKHIIILLWLIPLVFRSGDLGAHTEESEFIAYPNRGQWESHILYRAAIRAGGVFFEKNGIALQLSAPEDLQHNREASDIVRMHGLKIEYIGATNAPDVTSGDAAGAPIHYFLGNDPARWQSGVQGTRQITYKNLYPGIDMIWNAVDGHLKYTAEVSRAQDFSLCKWKYTGADSVAIQPDGRLAIYTSVRTIYETRPVVWQWIEGKKQMREARYQVSGDTISFRIDNIIPDLGLTIDPSLIFSTYTGSIADNFGFTATYDNSGNLYAGGRVYAAGYPVFGPYQSTFQGVYDASISKFNASGTQMLYSTYLGGSDQEQPHSLVVNSQNELIVLGTTRSLDFPLVQAVQGTHAGMHDIFLTRFNAAGDQLLAATYLGGSGEDGFNSFSLDYNYGDQYRGEVICTEQDEILIASNTASTNFPVWAGSFQPNLSGTQDGVVARFSPDLHALLWCSYLGGNSSDAAYGIKTDSVGHVYVTGGTRSSNFPVTSNGYQISYQGNTDGFVCKISRDGTQILHASYIGTAGYDQSYFLELDNMNQVYLYGQSTGNMPLIPSPSGPVYANPSGRQFISCLDSSLSQFVFSTVFGSGRAGPDISPTAFLVDKCGNIYCSGWAASFQGVAYPSNTLLNTQGLPVTPDAMKLTTDGTDFYLAVFRKYASGLNYGTYMGGNISKEHVDGGTSRFSPEGIVYHAVCAGCGGNSDFPVTPGVSGPSNNSTNCNLAAFKLDFEPQAKADFTFATTSLCPPYSVQFTYQGLNADAYYWDFGTSSGDTSIAMNPEFAFPESGTFSVTLISTEFTCMGSDTIAKPIELNPTLFADRTYSYDPCNPYLTLQYTGLPSDSVHWIGSTGDERNGNFAAFQTNPPETFTVIMVSYIEHCTDTILDSFAYASAPPASFEYTLDTCSRFVQFYAGVPDSMQVLWDFGDGSLSEVLEPKHGFPKIGQYTVRLMVKGDTCTGVAEMVVNLAVESQNPLFIPNVFTPNGDGTHDLFVPELQSGDQYGLYILDRWGNLLFHTQDPSIYWDGQSRGNAVAEGTYFYILKSVDCSGLPIERQGRVQVMR